MIILHQATPITTIEGQALLHYHWLITCCEFDLVESSGTWSTVKTGSTGFTNNLNPTHFYADSGSFINAAAPTGDVNRYIAIKDATNPENTVIGKITSVISTSEIVLDSSVNFPTNATALDYSIFDPINDAPTAGDYFVIANTVTTQPAWQVECLVSTSIHWTFAPIGGWSTVSHTFTGAVSSDYYMETSVAKLFCVASPDQGWFFTWVENNPLTVTNGVWCGALTPLHASGIAGIPEDESYCAIFGTAGTDDVNNISRDTTVADNICVGESLSSGGSMIPLYLAQKRLFSSTTVDVNSLALTATNVRSGESDDYDFVCFHRSPNQAWRGIVPGIRLLNNNLINRTLICSGATYVIGNGIGVSWISTRPAAV